MKEKMLAFAFSKGEISAGRFISNRKNLSIHDLSISMSKSESTTSHIVKGLEAKGIVETRRTGMKKIVNISDRNHAFTFSEIFKSEQYIPWENILSNSNIAVLLRDVTGESSFEDGVSSISKWRAVRNLSMYGMYINQTNGHSARNRNLSTFLREYSDFVSMKHLTEKLPADAAIIWRSGYNCLFKIRDRSVNESKELPDGSIITALTAAPNYGIQYITRDSYYFYEPGLDKLSLEDVILHTLLIDPESQTFNTYAILLMLKNKNEINLKLFLEKSQKYDLKESAKNLISYIKSEGKIRKWPLPDPKDLREQADLYGVRIS